MDKSGRPHFADGHFYPFTYSDIHKSAKERMVHNML